MMPRIYGMVGRFGTPDDLRAAVQRIHAAGYRRAEAYSPFPVEGVADRLRPGGTGIPAITLIAGICGGFAGFFMCWYASVISFPTNIGGRPLNSWPAYIPITFEMTVLFASVACAGGMLMLNGLPRLHHPIFNTPDFTSASDDQFFLCVEACDPHYDAADVRGHMLAAGATQVSEVRR